MTLNDQIKILKGMANEPDEEILLSYLTMAGDIIIGRVYPFRHDVTEVPVKYHSRQVEIAGYLLNKRGAEGENYHSENGINRSYEGASVPASMLKDVVPYAGVIV